MVFQIDSSESTSKSIGSEDEHMPKTKETTRPTHIAEEDVSPFELPLTEDATLVESAQEYAPRVQRNRSATALFCRRESSALPEATQD